MDLQNLLIGLGILVASLLLLTGVLRSCSRHFNFRVQLFSLAIFSTSIIGSFYFMFGKEVALYLISGFSLGVGIALRPIFSKVLSGMVFDATHISLSDEIVIEKDNIRGKVYRVGLLHTWIKDRDGNLHMVGNKYLEETPVKVTLHPKRESQTSAESPGYSLLKFV